MKRTMIVLLIVVMIIGVACGKTEKPSGQEAQKAQTESESTKDTGEKITVVSTIYPGYDFAKEIGKDKIDLIMLIPPGAEVHSYEPTAKDIQKVKDSDVFIYVGGEDDAWVKRIIDASELQNTEIVAMMEKVDVIKTEHDHDHDHDHDAEAHEKDHDHDHDHDAEVHEKDHDHDHDHDAEAHEKDHDHDHDHDAEAHEKDHDHDHDHDAEAHEKDHDHEAEEHHHHHHHEHDEHVWTSPKNAIKIAHAVEEALVYADSKNADFYKENAKNYIEKLKALDKKYEEMVESAKRKTIVVADRFPFAYLTKAYGLDHMSAIEGCSHDAEESVASVKDVINYVKEHKVPVVYYIDMSNGNIANAVKEATGAETLLLHSLHTLSADELKEGKTYLSIMEENLENLRKGLN